MLWILEASADAEELDSEWLEEDDEEELEEARL